MSKAEGLEEGLVDGQGDGHGPSARDLVLDGVDVVGADGVPAGGRVVTSLLQYCKVWLCPAIGRLAVVGENVELRVPLPLEEGKGSIVGQTSVLTTVELVPDEATGEARVLVRVSFPVGDLLDGG